MSIICEQANSVLLCFFPFWVYGVLTSFNLLVPVMALHFEHEDTPELAHLEITDEIRKDFITHMTIAIPDIYKYFEPARQLSMNRSDKPS